MIVSVSRRTDVPAYYGEWFMRRVRSGWCEVSNPFNPQQTRVVDLTPGAVDCFVFWTRYPKTLYPHLPELDRLGHSYYFTYTVLDYPRYFEPRLPARGSRVALFKRISSLIGPGRIVWRYDPILLTDQTDERFHLERFKSLADELAPYTDTVVISLFDEYRKLLPRMRTLAQLGAARTHTEDDPERLRAFLGELHGIAVERGLRTQSCSESRDLTATGIEPGACIDAERIRTSMGVRVDARKDPGQRRLCNCVNSVDIGAYDTCPARCMYCYAIGTEAAVRARRGAHSPESPQLG